VTLALVARLALAASTATAARVALDTACTGGVGCGTTPAAAGLGKAADADGVAGALAGWPCPGRTSPFAGAARGADGAVEPALDGALVAGTILRGCVAPRRPAPADAGVSVGGRRGVGDVDGVTLGVVGALEADGAGARVAIVFAFPAAARTARLGGAAPTIVARRRFGSGQPSGTPLAPRTSAPFVTDPELGWAVAAAAWAVAGTGADRVAPTAGRPTRLMLALRAATPVAASPVGGLGGAMVVALAALGGFAPALTGALADAPPVTVVAVAFAGAAALLFVPDGGADEGAEVGADVAAEAGLVLGSGAMTPYRSDGLNCLVSLAPHPSPFPLPSHSQAVRTPIQSPSAP
jgi:hypothetical protein